MNYNIIHGSLLVLTFLLLVVGLVFSRKWKSVRGIVWTLTGVSFICYCAMSFNHNRVLTTVEKEIVGLYLLDTTKSLYHSKKLEDNINAVLRVKMDNTFEVSIELPFFYSRKGSWTYFDNGDMSGIRGKFDKSGEEFEIYDIHSSMSFSDFYLKNADKGDEIVFVRQ